MATEEKTEKTKPWNWPSFTLKRAVNGWVLEEDPYDYGGRSIYNIGTNLTDVIDMLKARVEELAREHPEA